MKITCSQNDLMHAVLSVQKAVAIKTTHPVITGIYFFADQDTLELQATDYEIGISCTIPAKVEQSGKIVLSGKYLQELVRKLPGDEVKILSDEENKMIRITAGSAQFNLLSIPYEEFPVLKPFETDKNIVIQDHVFKDLIRKTVFACSNDEARPVFTGALLETDQQSQSIRMVATNTHRLALKQIKNISENKPLKMIISAKILNELAKLMTSDQQQDIKISWHKNQVGFQFDKIYMNANLIDGQFPDYNRVIPSNFETTAIIPTDHLLEAVERVALLAKDADYNVIKFHFTKNELIITSNNPDIGKASETLPLALQGKEIEIAFNARYIVDILKNIEQDQINFSLNSALSPASIQPHDDEAYIYIITPVRTK